MAEPVLKTENVSIRFGGLTAVGGLNMELAEGGITSLIVLTADQRELANSVLSWTLGSLAGTRWDELGLPVTETGLALPCGATGRWFSE